MSRRTTEQMIDRAIDTAKESALNGACTLLFGTVTAVNTTTKVVTVTVAGKSIPGVPYMASYSPTVNDVAWLLHQGSILVAIGKP